MTLMTLRLVGPSARGARVGAAVLRDLLDALVEGVQRSIRLRVEGRSVAQGPLPAWLEAAASLELVGLGAGSTRLVMEAPPLAEAAKQRFAQGEFWPEFDPDQSGFELFVASLSDATRGDADSDLYDDGLLGSFTKFRSVLDQGIQQIRFENGRTVAVECADLETFVRLRRDTPPDQRVLLAGKLDVLRHSKRQFLIRLDDATNVSGVFADDMTLDSVGEYWGKTVQLAGVAKFRPSGRVLRIEADRVEAAVGDVSLWSALPVPVTRDFAPHSLRVPQGPKSGVGALFGQWPGDETDDDIAEALAQLS